MTAPTPDPRLAGTRLRRTATFFLDLDGCIWFGDELAPGAVALVDLLRSTGRRVAFVTNATGTTAAHVAAKLTRLGIGASEADTITPLSVLPEHPSLATGRPALLIGNALMRKAVTAAGVALTNDPDAAGVVIASRDEELTYDHLARACLALNGGATLLAMNVDTRFPVEGGRYLPGTGAVVAALTAATGVSPVVIGKPAAYFFDRALARFGAERSTTTMVGDNLDSDVAGGRAAGLFTVQVGGSRFSVHAAPPVPDLAVTDLHELCELLTRAV